jgi:hypothetical protein
MSSEIFFDGWSGPLRIIVLRIAGKRTERQV